MLSDNEGKKINENVIISYKTKQKKKIKAQFLANKI